jgi:predicted transcriptional regulator
MSNKELVIEAVRDLPEAASFDEIMEQIAILAAIQRGEEAADAGRVISHAEMVKRASGWTSH